MGPIKYAQYLCETAPLTRVQRGPVALLARDMQHAYDKDVERRAGLTDAQRQAEGIVATEHAILPLTGRRLRMLVFGGGGRGKTRIINLVMAKLFRRFYGRRGLVLTAFANKPARLEAKPCTTSLKNEAARL